MAEVLITLGVIGVVAAITLPTLIKNHQKQVLVTQLKQTVSVVENAFRMMLAKEGVENLFDIAILNYEQGYYCLFDPAAADNVQSEECKAFIDYIKKSFNAEIVDANPKTYYLGYPDRYFDYTDDGYKALLLKNGAYIDDLSVNDNQSEVFIDVNGSKKPDMFGRDYFEFIIDKNGRVMKNSRYKASDCTPTTNSKIANRRSGGCFNRIIENGWKMDY